MRMRFLAVIAQGAVGGIAVTVGVLTAAVGRRVRNLDRALPPRPGSATPRVAAAPVPHAVTATIR